MKTQYTQFEFDVSAQWLTSSRSSLSILNSSFNSFLVVECVIEFKTDRRHFLASKKGGGKNKIVSIWIYFWCSYTYVHRPQCLPRWRPSSPSPWTCSEPRWLCTPSPHAFSRCSHPTGKQTMEIKVWYGFEDMNNELNELNVLTHLFIPWVFLVFYPVVLELAYQQFWFFWLLLIQFSVLHLLEEVSFPSLVLSHLSEFSLLF